MMKKMTTVFCGLAMMACSISAYAADDAKAKVAERLTAASQVIEEIMATPDKAIPGGILKGASCVVVIPSFKKGAFVVGAQYGQGVATCRTASGRWSAPGVCATRGRQLRISDWRTGDRPGADRHEPAGAPGHAEE